MSPSIVHFGLSSCIALMMKVSGTSTSASPGPFGAPAAIAPLSSALPLSGRLKEMSPVSSCLILER